jgi:tetratricopeptide (TPR) repeat protein
MPSNENDPDSRNIVALFSRMLPEFLRRLSDPDRGLSKPELSVEDLFRKGVALWKSGNVESAKDVFDRVIQLDPSVKKAYAYRSGAHIKNRKYDQAIKDYEKIIELEPKDPWPYYNRGVTYLGLGQDTAALADFDMVLSLNAHYADTHYRRGYINAKLGQYEKAFQDFAEAIEQNKEDPRCYYERGFVHLTRQNYEAAINDFDRAIEFGIDDIRAESVFDYSRVNLYKGHACLLAGKYDSAIVSLEAFLETNFDDNLRSEVYYLLGHAYTLTKDYEAAHTNMNKAARMGNTKAQEFLDELGLDW